MEIEIVTLVVKGSAKLTVPTDGQELLQVASKSVALRRVFDLKLRDIYLTEIIFKVWVINWKYVIDVSIHVKLNWDANHFLPTESKDRMNSALSYQDVDYVSLAKQRYNYLMLCRQEL